jgi:hypothetical protein
MNDTSPPVSTDLQVHEITQAIIKQMLGLDPDARRRAFRTAMTFFGLEHAQSSERHVSMIAPGQRTTVAAANGGAHAPSFADQPELPAKDFLFQKQPRTDIERIACLAYYLAHYRDTKHFKTIDLSKLNTEAAQLKFSNSAYAVTNAANAGFLAQAGKGFKQLSALGERYVEALPDRDAAKQVFSGVRSRRSRKSNNHEAEK